MSQGSYNVPTSGSESAVTFAGQCNIAWDALASKNSGASTPANGPSSAALQFQDWMDNTSVTQVNWKVFDGTNWPRVGTMDVTNSIWIPKQGGGLGTIVAAATTDIYAQKETTLTVTGTTTITSFGSSGETGEWKKCLALASFTITNNASITTGTGANIAVSSGDTFETLNEGAGLTRILNYKPATAVTGFTMPTGSHFWMYQTGAQSGCVRANGLTIGSAASGATERAAADTVNLFTQLWTASNGVADTESTISGGRGGSAAADFAADKTITVTDLRGRSPYGLDDMGNSSAARITGTTASPNGTTLGAIFGAQTVTLAQANLPNVTLGAGTLATTATATFGGNNAIAPTTADTGTTVTTPGGATVFTTAGFHQFTINVAAFTGATASINGNVAQTAVNKMSPGKMGTWYIVL